MHYITLIFITSNFYKTSNDNNVIFVSACMYIIHKKQHWQIVPKYKDVGFKRLTYFSHLPKISIKGR